MGKEAIADRIISDANKAAEEIINNAEKSAAGIIAQAEKDCERAKLGVRAEVAEKSKAIADGKAASARLDGAKILLAEKRRVVDAVYESALKRLKSLEKSKALKLAGALLEQYAEKGDEIVFAADYAFKSDVAQLGAVKEKGLKVSAKTADISGGFILIGKNSDKDVSFSALLAADREEHQAELAAGIFGAAN